MRHYANFEIGRWLFLAYTTFVLSYTCLCNFIIWHIHGAFYINTKSTMANAVTNFLNWVANWTKSVILDPIVDIWSTAVKWIAWGTAALAGKDSKNIRENIDKAASQLKWEMQQPKQADSMAYAIWEWLPVWVDNAAWAVGLWMLAKQLPKAAQSWFNKILNRVKDAKSKSDQMKLAKEAREYLNAYRDPERVAKEVSNRTEVPSYQQRRKAEFNNTVFAEPSERWVMEPYRWVKSTPEWQMKTISNITEEFKNNPNSNVRSMIAESQIDPDAYTAVYWPRSWWPMNTMNDATKLAPVNAATTSDVNWLSWQQYRKWTYWDRLKNTGKKFTSQRKALDKIAKEWWFTVDQARKLAAENGTTTKKILNDSAAASRWMDAEDAKYAKNLWMTVDQLRSESLKHWLSPYSYFEHQKRLKDMWFKNMEELDKYVRQAWFESIWDAGDAYQRMWEWMNFKDFINKNSSNEYYNKVMKYDPSLYFWTIL